jgi:uncharacterized membrane protein YeaQ/YmgE (transglycosylase-associated protein family)
MDAAGKLFTDAAELVLVWIGFGTVVALLASLILPGRNPGGTLASVLVGIFGSVIRITPVSIYGFPIALFATTLLLAIYRILYSRANHPIMALLQNRRGPIRRRATIVEE